MFSTMKPKLIVIVGPTAVGKSALAIRLARTLGGAIISGDSRQVYKGLNIGSGKITKREMQGIPHYLLDVASPKRTYTAQHFTRDAQKAITKIRNGGKTPIIVGGTGHYIDALVAGVVLPNVPPNKILRARLEKKSAEELYVMLQKKDPQRAHDIDKHNKRRLIRALEIINALGAVPKQHTQSPYDALYIGITLPMAKLKQKIHTRLHERMKHGMVAEVRRLHAHGVSWKRLEELGLEYRYIAQHLQGKLSREAMLAKLETEIYRYAKRQMTWFKRNQSIHWFPPTAFSKIQTLSKNFLKE